MNGKRFSENKARRNGFYLALAVCLVAVGIAAWSTYDAVHSYVAPESSAAESSRIQQQNRDVREGQGASQIDREDPEAPRRTSSAAPSRQTVGSVTSKTESSAAAPSPEPSPQPEEPDVEEAPVPANAPLYEISGELTYPLGSNEIVKAYSAGAPVYSETMKDWRVHTGMDVTAEAGEEVHACGNGRVKQTYTDSMLGNVVLIEHGDYEFSYCGLGENFLVAEGDIVTKGQAIGTVTAIPSEAADAPHLHIEVRRDGVYLNPQSVIEGQE